jgi:hypothetical protein
LLVIHSLDSVGFRDASPNLRDVSDFRSFGSQPGINLLPE